MTAEQKWNDMTQEERLIALRKEYPFDCLMFPKPFMAASRKLFCELPEITRNVLERSL